MATLKLIVVWSTDNLANLAPCGLDVVTRCRDSAGVLHSPPANQVPATSTAGVRPQDYNNVTLTPGGVYHVSLFIPQCDTEIIAGPNQGATVELSYGFVAKNNQDIHLIDGVQWHIWDFGQLNTVVIV